MSAGQYRKRRVMSVEVEGETFHFRVMNGEQVEKLLQIETGNESLDGIRAMQQVVCWCACDESGKREFGDDDLALVQKEVDMPVIRAVSDAAMDASGLKDSPGN